MISYFEQESYCRSIVHREYACMPKNCPQCNLRGAQAKQISCLFTDHVVVEGITEKCPHLLEIRLGGLDCNRTVDDVWIGIGIND